MLFLNGYRDRETWAEITFDSNKIVTADAWFTTQDKGQTDTKPGMVVVESVWNVSANLNLIWYHTQGRKYKKSSIAYGMRSLVGRNQNLFAARHIWKIYKPSQDNAKPSQRVDSHETPSKSRRIARTTTVRRLRVPPCRRCAFDLEKNCDYNI